MLLALTAGASVSPAAPQPPTPASADQAEFFESQIRPLLSEHCFECHSARVEPPFGGLRLDSREALLAGGDSGPAVVPGDAAGSRLVERVQGRPVLMPPTGALASADIAALVAWVEMGAP